MGKNTQNTKENVTDVTLSDKKENFIKAFKKKNCNVAKTCKDIKISRQTYYRWRKEDKFKQACEDVEEGLLDFAESQLQTLIKNGNAIAIFFFLKTKGKKRGYVEKQEIESNIKPIDEIVYKGL